MDNCKIIEDLLPSYCDGVTSEETNELIQSHVKDCPQCARLLEKMSAEPPREIIDHWEQFRRKLKEYEHRHKVKTLRILLACFIALSLLLLCWRGSYAISKWIADIKLENSVSYLVYKNETESRYIYYTLYQPTMVTLAKNDTLGFWYIAQMDDSSTHVWFGESNLRWAKGRENTVEFEFHYLYCGADAEAYIEFEDGDIPGNVMVEVQQTGNQYWIHVVSCDKDAINQLNMTQLLKTKGFVE